MSITRHRKGANCLCAAIVAVALATGGARCSRAQPAPLTLDTFIAEFVAPADGGGVDLSAKSFADAAANTRSALDRLRSIDRAGLSPDERIDWRFAESILQGRLLSQERVESWKRDPRVYLGFRPIPSAMGRPGDALAKVDDVVRSLKAVPVRLENGARNLAVDVPRFRELGLFMAEGSLAVFDTEVPAFAESVPTRKDEILQASRDARAAVDRFIVFLKNDLPQKPKGDFAIGRETYDLMLEQQYMLPYDSENLYAYAWEQFNQTVKELEAIARQIDPQKTWQQIAREVKNEHPAPEQMIQAHQDWVDKSAAHIRAHDLVPIPWKEQVTVVPRADTSVRRRTTEISLAHRERTPMVSSRLNGRSTPSKIDGTPRRSRNTWSNTTGG